MTPSRRCSARAVSGTAGQRRHGRDELLRIGRFGEVHLIAGEQHGTAIFHARESRQRDGRQLRRADPGAADLANQFIAVARRHADVADEHLWSEVVEPGERGVDFAAFEHFGAGFAEHAADERGVTFRYKDYRREGAERHRVMTLPADVREYPDAIAQALSQLRLVGVNGPYKVLLGADAYTALAETSDNGYPVLEHIRKLVKDEIIWAPAIAGAFVLTTRGGDFDLHIGQDVSIGYLSHTDKVVRLYLQETLTFLLLTTEAAVAIGPAGKKKG